MKTDPKITKWQRWIVIIEHDVTGLEHYRRCNRVFEKIVEANPRLMPGNMYLDYFRNVYATYAAMAVRRQAKGHQDSISLVDLLADIVAHPTVLSRTWMRWFYAQPLPSGTTYPEEFAHRLADATFASFADGSGEYIDGAQFQARIKQLEQATDNIVHIVDRELAHRDKRGATVKATFDQLDLAIANVSQIATDCSRLLTGKSSLSTVPIDLTNAIDVFKFPWIDDQRPPKLDPRDI